MKGLISNFIYSICLFSVGQIEAQSKLSAVENALEIVAKNKNQLKDVSQLLVVYTEGSATSNAALIALEKIDNQWTVVQNPIAAVIGKNGFALPDNKVEGDGKSPTGIFRIGKLFSYEKQYQTLLENQQTNKDDKWIDDPNSPDYNTYIKGNTNAKSYENLLLANDAYKYCIIIEYNTSPVIKGKGSAIFLHLALRNHNYTLGCVAIEEELMKVVVDWLDAKKNPTIIMGDLAVLKTL